MEGSGALTEDPYLLFTQCHRLYVRGVRRALRERLESAYGGTWWDDGVMGALSNGHRTTVKRLMDRDPERSLELHLDSAHFSEIVGMRRAAFSDAFGDPLAVFTEFRSISRMRNEWGHVQDMPFAKTMSSIRAMRSVLASLRQSEALEVDRLIRNLAGESQDMAVDEATESRFADSADDLDDDYDPDDVALPPPALWKRLQSFLAVNTSAAIDSDDNAVVTVEVSNTALAGEGMPEVWFGSVVIHANNVSGRDGRRREKDGIGVLGPGESRSVEYACPRNALATVSFSVSGNLDMDKFFHFQNQGTLPSEIVSPILDEFFERFEALDIKDPFEKALDAVKGISPSTTIEDLRSARSELDRIKSLVADKSKGMVNLFKEFHLRGPHPLAEECSGIIGHLNQVAEHIQTAETAIGSIDLEAITEVTRDLEQIQIDVLRVEDAVRNMRCR